MTGISRLQQAHDRQTERTIEITTLVDFDELHTVLQGLRDGSYVSVLIEDDRGGSGALKVTTAQLFD